VGNLLQLENIIKYADNAAGEAKNLILDNVSLTVKKRQIIGILGKSGSGKSTLLRIIAGLATPSSGQVKFCPHTTNSNGYALSMIFQSFALFPWLTVAGNVELALKSQKLAADQATKLAHEAINLVGLHGFEHAYPKELSGGMKQRVGFARALVVKPQILLMDEPFSALDILTAETLKSDLMDLWLANNLDLQSIIMVTHNIEEAVALCDRVIIMASSPGKITVDMPIDIKRPRNRYDPEFKALVNEIYTAMTSQINTHNN
jgi:NitT/TauT family transport system ATP-binding protein